MAVRNRLDESGSADAPGNGAAGVGPSAAKPRDRLDDSGGSESSDGNAVIDAQEVQQRRGARRRRQRDDGGVPEITHVTEEMSKQVGGGFENPDKCKARVWQGRGPCPSAQCIYRPLAGSEFCGRHAGEKWKAHGRIDHILALELYKKFHKAWKDRQSGDQSKKRGKHWYTRHHMWRSAVNVRRKSSNLPLENLDDLELPEKIEARYRIFAALKLRLESKRQKRRGGG